MLSASSNISGAAAQIRGHIDQIDEERTRNRKLVEQNLLEVAKVAYRGVARANPELKETSPFVLGLASPADFTKAAELTRLSCRILSVLSGVLAQKGQSG